VLVSQQPEGPASAAEFPSEGGHDNGHFRLGLTVAETNDLIEHLEAL